MLPELLVGHVLLSMCGDRLGAIVVDDGQPGPWLLGRDPEAAPSADDMLEQLLRATDPSVLLLLWCGWRCIAIELCVAGQGVERVELLASSISAPYEYAGPDEARWFVPIIRGSRATPVGEGHDWELRFELTPQPLVEARLRLPLGSLEDALLVDLSDGAEQRLQLVVGGDGSFSVDAVHALLNEDGSQTLRGLADLLAEAADRFDDVRFEQIGLDELPDQTGMLGALASARWTIQAIDLIGLSFTLATELAPVIAWLSDRIIGAEFGACSDFFLDQARHLAGPSRASIEQVEAVLGDQADDVRGILYEAWTGAEPALRELGRASQGGAWTGWVVGHALELCMWMRLHDEGVIDLVRPVSEDIHAQAYAAIDKAWSGEPLSGPEYTLVLALLRRHPTDARAPEADAVSIGGTEFGGFWITGVPGTHAAAEMNVNMAVVLSSLFWGRWRVIAKLGADPAALGEHEFLLLPHPDVAPLAQALWEWTIGAGESAFVPMAALSEARRLALARALPEATVALEQRVAIDIDYKLLPSPAAVLDAIGLPGSLDGGPLPTGKGVIVGHPDTGVTDPIHAAIDARVQKPVDAINRAQMGTPGWPQHGTTTSSALLGSGSFPGVDPMSGREQLITCRGVAPEASLIPWRVGNFVVLMTNDDWFRDDFSPADESSVERLIAALRHFAGADQDTRRADVVSISLGYKYDVFRPLDVRRDVHVSLWPPSVTTTMRSDAILAELQAAAELAYARGVIVCAAAGQGVDGISGGSAWIGGPTYPAAFDRVVGCAGLQGDGRPWDPSFRGAGVNVSVPCDGAWGCTFDEDGREIIMQSAGTSYATALTAGVASLWIERNGARLDAAGHNRAAVFHHVLASCGFEPVRERPDDPSSPVVPGFGHGRLDAGKVLGYDFSARYPV